MSESWGAPDPLGLPAMFSPIGESSSSSPFAIAASSHGTVGGILFAEHGAGTGTSASYNTVAAAIGDLFPSDASTAVTMAIDGESSTAAAGTNAAGVSNAAGDNSSKKRHSAAASAKPGRKRKTRRVLGMAAAATAKRAEAAKENFALAALAKLSDEEFMNAVAVSGKKRSIGVGFTFNREPSKGTLVASGDGNETNSDVKHAVVTGKRSVKKKGMKDLFPLFTFHPSGTRVSATSNSKWIEHFSGLQSYYEVNGDCAVPVKRGENAVLGGWAKNQRIHWKKMTEGDQHSLTVDRIKRLHTLNFGESLGLCEERTQPSSGAVRETHHVADDVHQTTCAKETATAASNSKAAHVAWMHMMDHLLKFHSVHEHCLVPLHFDVEDAKLGIWLERQRRMWKRRGSGEPHLFSDEQVEALKGVNFEAEIPGERQRLSGGGSEAAQLSATKTDKGLKWMRAFDKLVSYHADHGDCSVPADHGDADLAKWAKGLKREWDHHCRAVSTSLTTEQIRLLENIPFDAMETEAVWNDMFGRFNAFKQTHGDCNVPGHFPQDEALATWVKKQKRVYRGMEASVENEQCRGRIAALRSIGFEEFLPVSGIFATEQKRNEQWYAMLSRLRQYKEVHEDCYVHRSYKPDVPLARWVCRHRFLLKQLEKGEATSLTKRRLDALRGVGFDMTGGTKKKYNRTVLDVKWENNFKELVKFKDIFGHCDVSEWRDKDEYPKLSVWVSVQRAKFKKRKHISDEQIKKLAALGFRFSMRDDFEARFNQLLEYKRIHGHTRIPVHDPGYNKLGRWAARMRDGILNNEPWLDEVKKARLLGIDFDYERREQFDWGKRRKKKPDQDETDYAKNPIFPPPAPILPPFLRPYTGSF